MDIDQSLEDLVHMDEDLELLESPPPTTNTKKSSEGISINKSKCKGIGDARLNIEDDVNDSKKFKSEVWNYFERGSLINGVEKCKCKRCSKLYTCKSESGTSHLRRHFNKCYNSPSFHDVGTLLEGQTTLFKKWKFDSKAYRDALSRCMIRYDLPFSYAEYEGVSAVNKTLNLEFKPVSRNTAKADCKSVFLTEKAKLKSVLANLLGRICLTSDMWTTVTTQGYMAVTAHYVDENWTLNSKLLSFCNLESPHTGLELSSKLLGVLKDWGIDSKIFSITLDNASTNDNMQKILKERLNLQNGLLCGGEYFHVRCCAHILNIIVQEGLKATGKALQKIRESVKHVRSSEGRLQQFQKCIDEVHLTDVGGSLLRLDVATRWNATYLMLESAIKYRRAFTSLSYNDRNYKICPTNEEWDEWERAERVCAFLVPFYHITNLISGSSYSTSNLYFMQVASIEMKLNENLACEDEVIKDMASRMKGKFDKYWNAYSATLALGSVLDPKAKLQFLSFCYRRLYPLDYQEKVNQVKKSLYKLFGEYEHKGVALSSFPPNLSHSQPHSNSLASGSSSSSVSSILDKYHQKMRQKTSNDRKSQLDKYLEEECIVGGDRNVFEYWRINKDRFPQLAIMACDILSIPITTMASESSFSIGGRILHKYRNCLLHENVQALICTRSWLHGFKECGPSDVQEVEKISLSKEDSNIVLDDD